MSEKKEKGQMGRPKHPRSEKRVKHTTAIDADLLKWVKHYAIEEGYSSADIIEQAVSLYKTQIARRLKIED